IGCSSQTCGYTLRCEACEASMVMHRDHRLPQGGHVKCHHCLRANRLPSTCPDCGKGLIKLGLGTQRLEEVLREELPHLNADQIVRVDSDQISGLQDLHEILGAFGRREIRVLLGTQMIAKGLDFPGVRLVGVVSADTALQLPDFRASERTFQLVSQVAGRAGRTADGPQARVIVQSMHPDNPAVLHAAAHEWDRFAEHELAMRAGAGLPPVKRMARIVFRDRDVEAAGARANAAAQALSNTSEQIELLGPAPCPMARIDDRHRIGLEVLGETPGTLGRALAKARVAGGLKPGEKMVIDVDPTTLL
ncbi:MAG: primosomal protein N', partial [Planctomycetota bacterium]|nr:primosomal protein N' [Planctomycetota bacterium]